MKKAQQFKLLSFEMYFLEICYYRIANPKDTKFEMR